MGWSCASKANDTLRKWSDACAAQTRSSNVYVVGAKRYFYEVSRVEHNDGAITGTIISMLDGTGTAEHCLGKRVGSFRIEPDGTVSRAPSFLKAAAK